MKALDIVIFGGSGDLSLRKLMPALYFLYSQGKIPKGSRILGVSRSSIEQAEFKTMILEKLKLYLGSDYNQARAESFAALLDYMALGVSDDLAWAPLKAYLNPIGTKDVIYYMAVPPALFGVICEQLDRNNLIPDNSRLVVEKPLGEDLPTAEAVNKILSASFKENQIYRIDHYLGKQAVQNILSFRFEKGAVEGLWSREFIDQVQITVAETVGVEGRADFLDRVGVLRDMIQNHLMQILSFIAMDAPENLAADAVRDQKVQVVKSLRPVTDQNISEHVVRAQYDAGDIMNENVPSYAEEIKDKDIAGTGETFIAVKACVDNDRWRDVPFYLRTGKRLSGRFARIVVHFKENDKNIKRIVINIQPDMTVEITPPLTGVDGTADYKNSDRMPDAYEKLLGDVMEGSQAYFVRHDEIVASWTWIDGIRKSWDATKLGIKKYTAGSMGPKASDDLLKKSNHIWDED